MRRLGDSGPVVLLLHGLAASGRAWGVAYDGLGAVGRLVVPDLLGFGASPRPALGYGPDEHVDAILDCLDRLGLGGEPLIIGAHSLGAVLALRLATRPSRRVVAIVAFGPPIYPDRRAALEHLGRLGLMARLSMSDERVARAMCRWACAHRRAAAVLAQVVMPDLPGPIAADGLQHTWPSYSETLERVILASPAHAWFERIAAPVQFVVGDRDLAMDVPYLRELAAGHSDVTLRIISETGHDLPLSRAVDANQVLFDLVKTSGG